MISLTRITIAKVRIHIDSNLLGYYNQHTNNSTAAINYLTTKE